MLKVIWYRDDVCPSEVFSDVDEVKVSPSNGSVQVIYNANLGREDYPHGATITLSGGMWKVIETPDIKYTEVSDGTATNTKNDEIPF